MTATRELGPISAVVCNYNGEAYLAGCLDSILAQGDDVDEVIVVDNGSEDGSVALVRERYPDVQLVEVGANRGPCVARNVGMRAARNRWVLAVDNDAILTDGLVASLRAVAEERPDAVIVQPRSVHAEDPSQVHYDGARFHYVGLLSLRNFYRPLAEVADHGVLPVDGAIAITLLCDRGVVLDEAGGYDEDFFILFEDYDLSLRLRIAGHGIYSDEDTVVLHRGGTPGISFRAGAYPKIRAFYHSRNRWLLLVKTHRWWTLLVSLPALVAYELVWALFTLTKGHFKAWTWGKFSFFRSLPAALRKRRAIQRSRRVGDRALLVGGPITLSPDLVAKPLGRLAARGLDTVLRGWWTVVRLLVP